MPDDIEELDSEVAAAIRRRAQAMFTQRTPSFDSFEAVGRRALRIQPMPLPEGLLALHDGNSATVDVIYRPTLWEHLLEEDHS